MMRLDEREECGYRPPLTTYRRAPRPMPEHRPHPWLLVATVALLLMCAAVAGARSWTIERLEAENAALTAEVADLRSIDEKRRSEIDGLAQRAIDAELEAAALAEDLDALKPGPSR